MSSCIGLRREGALYAQVLSAFPTFLPEAVLKDPTGGFRWVSPAAEKRSTPTVRKCVIQPGWATDHARRLHGFGLAG